MLDIPRNILEDHVQFGAEYGGVDTMVVQGETMKTLYIYNDAGKKRNLRSKWRHILLRLAIWGTTDFEFKIEVGRTTPHNESRYFVFN